MPLRVLQSMWSLLWQSYVASAAAAVYRPSLHQLTMRPIQVTPSRYLASIQPHHYLILRYNTYPGLAEPP